jgi:PAS domain S-box-containing protein
MKISILQKPFLFSFIILVGIGGLEYADYKSDQKLLNSQQWVHHTEQVIYQSDILFSTARDMETAPKAFIITNDSSFLRPLFAAQKMAFVYISRLRQLTLDNPSQQQRIDSLAFYMHKCFDFSFRMVELRSKQGSASAIAYANNREGKYYNGHISQIINRIQQEEGILLKLRKLTNERSIAVFNYFSVATYVLIVGFTILLLIITGKYLIQIKEKERRAAELVIANKELLYQNEEKGKRAAELVVANKELLFQNEEKEKQVGEKENRAAELAIANKELLYQNEEKGKRAAELVIANKELLYQNEEKEKRAAELVIANDELLFQNEEKENRAAELAIANHELSYQNEEKGKRAAELVIANKELSYQNNEKGKRAAELVIANEELLYQNEEKEKRAAELVIANKELSYQNEEKGKRAAELIIANKELSYQNEEKGKRAAELVIANKELSYQNDEKGKRAAELSKANRLYAFLSQINQNILHIKNEQTLFQTVCQIAIEYGKFKIAWVGIFDNLTNNIAIANQIGIVDEDTQYFNNVPLKADGPNHHALRTAKYYICNDILNAPELEDWKPLAVKRSIRSCMILPIKKCGKVIGLYNLYAEEPNFFKKEEIEMLVEVTGDISFALDLFEKEKVHRQMQELVVQNEKRFRALIEKSADMITLSTADGDLIYVSASVTNGLGYSAEDIMHTSVFNIIHPDSISEMKENRDKILPTPGKSFYYQQRRKHKNGSWIWCEGTLTNMLHEPGINAMVSNFRDISQKKITEAQQEFDRNNLDALINNTNDLMWSVDRDFNIITSNQPFDDILKLTSGKAIEKGFNVLDVTYSAEQSKPHKELYERAFTGESFTEIIYNEPPVNSWTEISYYPIRKGDEIVGTACHSHDITERKKAEATLKQSENRLKESQAVAQLGNWELDFATNIAIWSEEHCRIYGLSPGEYKQTYDSWLSFIHPDDLNHVETSLNESRKTQNDIVLNHRIILKDGSLKHIHAESKFEFDKNGKPVGLYGIAHDVTATKIAEENLKQSESSLKKAQAIAHIGNFEIDMVDNSEVWSDEMYQILKIEKEHRPETKSFSSFIHPDDLPSCREAFNSLKDASMDYRLIRSDGVLRYANSEWRFEFDRNKKPVRLYGVLQDITERKLAEIERAKLANDMMLRNTELEQFGYIISHNLRAPVANIIGASGALNDPDLSIEDKEILNRGINISVSKLDNVVKDLNHILEVKGEINDTKEIVHFSTLADDIKFSIQNLIDKYNIEIRYDFSELNEFLTVRAYLYSIFYNLISNSIKYRRQQVHCIIKIESRLVKNKLELTFTDNGMGIDLKKSGEDVFGLYKRFHTYIEGKGMGLFMVKTQIETLGGKVSIQSAENVGTEFKIEFDL